MLLLRSCLLFILISLSLVHAGWAGITQVTGAVTVVSNPPADVSSNQWESNTLIRIFSEQSNFLLPQNVSVDISVPGTSPSAVDSNLSPALISSGQYINSYTLHFDVNGTRQTNNALEATGSVTFAEAILGLIVLSQSENDTNALLGRPGLTYSNGTDHGLELNPAGTGTSDLITLSADLHTVTLDLQNASFADDVRVLTIVPEPGALLLAVLGGCGALLRRRVFSLSET